MGAETSVYEVKRFRFAQPFKLDHAEDFVRALLESPALGGASRAPLGGKVANVDLKRLNATHLTMDMLDRLRDANILWGDDLAIRKCIEEHFDGAPTGDLLRDMLLNEDSENF